MDIVTIENGHISRVRIIDGTTAADIPSDLYAEGYRPVSTPPTPLSPTDEMAGSYLMYTLRYEFDGNTDSYIGVFDEVVDVSRVEGEIARHQTALASTDYIVTKYAEAAITPAAMTDDPDAPDPTAALNLDKYDLPAILKERAELRERIRSLRRLLETPETVEEP